MRTLWPNLEGKEGLETVLEVPVPDEMFAGSKSGGGGNSWRALKNWLITPRRPSSNYDYATRAVEIQFLLGIIGAPLLPLPISSSHHHHTLNHRTIKSHPIERSMASYIVKQYVAASGGEHALNSIESMCAIGKVKMAAASKGEDLNLRKMKQQQGELGGFVLWQKAPHLWSLELMVSGFKISAGGDAKAAWRQTPWQHSGASRGPPRPLRRSLQGLDPRRTADLFSNSICTGERTINGQDCFVLKLEAEASALKARSSSSSEVMKHTIWGCFSQKTGLLLHLQDSHSLRIKSAGKEILWETKTESFIQDYRTIDGVNIAHGGRTTVWLSRYDEEAESLIRSKMEEIWSIEEVDFNVKGLSADCFLPPADLGKEEHPDCDGSNEGRLRYEVLDKYSRNCGSRGGKKKVAAIDEDYCTDSDDDEL